LLSEPVFGIAEGVAIPIALGEQDGNASANAIKKKIA
jgi:hypothetical protein